MVSIQAVKAEKFDQMAQNQRLTTIKLVPERGIIYDRNREILSISLDKDTVFANPLQIKGYQKRVVARRLAPILKLSRRSLYKKLKMKLGFVYIKRKVDKNVTAKIKNLNIEGIGFIPESKRFYPGKAIAAHVIGFAGMDNDGLNGVEQSFDSYLKGKPGQLIMEQDLVGRPIPGGEYKYLPPTHGRDLILTLDKEIQYKAQVELRRAVNKWKATAGWIVVMDSQTGEVYALANYPTYNLNKFSETDPKLFRNRAISDVYEPGSTMKIVTASAALEEKLYSPGTLLNLPGRIQVGGHTIHEAHERGAEIFSFKEIVTRSSNIGAVVIGQSLGPERIYQYIERFGLNKGTGAELPDEGQGYTPPTNIWSASSIANIPFGQGLSATSLESVRAINVVAAEGKLISPRFTRKDLGGSKQVISKATAASMAEIMTEAVENGTGGNAKVSGYKVAGKTGTAQKPKVGARGYDPGKYISSFIGFLPADNPKLTILVAIDEPQGAIYGGVVAAPVFSAVGEYALKRLRVQP